MNFTRDYTRRRWLPAYHRNALLQLIVISGIAYVCYHGIRATLWMSTRSANEIFSQIESQLLLPSLEQFPSRFWTVFTYGWLHHGFWELFTNMVWMYCFGSVLQALIGFRQIIPMYFYGLILGGLFFEGIQMFPGTTPAFLMLGGQAGIVALAVGALTVSPGFRFHIGDRFSIPLVLVAILFFALMIMNTDLQPASLALLFGGAVVGYTYVRLLQRGFRPGAWIYQIVDYFDRLVQPKPVASAGGKRRRHIPVSAAVNDQDAMERRVDEILDKIHEKGYPSLSREEKEILMRASTEDS